VDINATWPIVQGVFVQFILVIIERSHTNSNDPPLKCLLTAKGIGMVMGCPRFKNIYGLYFK